MTRSNIFHATRSKKHLWYNLYKYFQFSICIECIEMLDEMDQAPPPTTVNIKFGSLSHVMYLKASLIDIKEK